MEMLTLKHESTLKLNIHTLQVKMYYTNTLHIHYIFNIHTLQVKMYYTNTLHIHYIFNIHTLQLYVVCCRHIPTSLSRAFKAMRPLIAKKPKSPF